MGLKYWRYCTCCAVVDLYSGRAKANEIKKEVLCCFFVSVTGGILLFLAEAKNKYRGMQEWSEFFCLLTWMRGKKVFTLWSEYGKHILFKELF